MGQERISIPDEDVQEAPAQLEPKRGEIVKFPLEKPLSPEELDAFKEGKRAYASNKLGADFATLDAIDKAAKRADIEAIIEKLEVEKGIKRKISRSPDGEIDPSVYLG